MVCSLFVNSITNRMWFVKDVLERITPYKFISHTKNVDHFRNGIVHKVYARSPKITNEPRTSSNYLNTHTHCDYALKTPYDGGINISNAEKSTIVVNRTLKMRQRSNSSNSRN